ncbi:MAG: HD domain-containing protein [Ignisphaera sp.]
MLIGERSRVVDLIEKLVIMLVPDDVAHGIGHVLRVRELALEIASSIEESVDREVLELVALLHDIGRLYSDEGHAKRSAEIARILLELANYPKDRITRVVEAIESHSFSEGKEPRAIEAKILSDADKLDAMGAIGIARVFSHSCNKGRSLEDSLKHFYDKILKLPKMMFTEPGKRMAIKRIEIIERYLTELKQELKTTNAIIYNQHEDSRFREKTTTS